MEITPMWFAINTRYLHNLKKGTLIKDTKKSIEVLKLLINKGLKLARPDIKGNFLQFVAIKCNNEDVLRFLRD